MIKAGHRLKCVNAKDSGQGLEYGKIYIAANDEYLSSVMDLPFVNVLTYPELLPVKSFWYPTRFLNISLLNINPNTKII